MRKATFLLASSCAFVFFQENAYAYLDPGTGSILIQGLIATVAAIAVAGRHYWQLIIGFLGLGGKSKVSSPVPPKSDDDEDMS